jgi:radical SAM superfamily enzyme YgiQ (UPF0313 family)
MRVLLCNPENDVWSSRKHIPLGLGYMASSLEAAGHTVRIYDSSVEDEALADVLAQGWDFAGISSTTPLIQEAWEVAATIKAQGITTILGGPHLTLMPEESLDQPGVDYTFKGEAEDGIVEFAEALAGKREIATVDGLYYKRDGRVVANAPRHLPKDIDRYPFPAHHLFKIEKYTNLQPLTDGLKRTRTFTILTSRGCPYQCTFCSKPITGKSWRERSVENVVAEWKWLVKDLQATEIGITDDIWNLKINRAKDICRGIIEEGANTVPWVTVHGMKVNSTDLELFQLMKKAGCKRVGFGVESGDPRILKEIIKKGQTMDMVREAFRNARKAGLQTMGFFIYGMPGETEETMEATTRFALELDPDLAHFMIAAPYPGTAMYDLIKKEGNIFANEWKDFAIQEAKTSFDFGDLKGDVVERKWREAYRRFYLRPRRVARRLAMADTWRRAPYHLQNAGRFFISRRYKHVAS